MGDTFNISKVDNLINNVPEMEISDISKIIFKMINLKNDIERIKQQKKRPYSIDDKISLNCLSNNLQHKVKKCHIDSYDIVDDSIDCIGEMESSIRSDLYDYYWETYIDVLSDMDIDIDNQECIKQHSDEIYINLIAAIEKQIFTGRQSAIEVNKRITYLNSITAYVFYKCKILIPIEDKKE